MIFRSRLFEALSFFRRWVAASLRESQFRVYAKLRKPLNVPPVLGDNRQSWCLALFQLLDAGKKFRFSLFQRLLLPRSIHGFEIDLIEFYFRSMLGVSFLLKSDYDKKLTLPLCLWYRNKVFDLLGKSRRTLKNNHLKVENTSVIVAFLLCPEELWDSLDSSQQDSFISHVRTHAFGQFYENNWLWFKLFHLLFLERMADEDTSEEQEIILHEIDKMHVADGWYRDGYQSKDGQVDYYSAWAMQFYGMIYCQIYGKNRLRNLPSNWENRSKKFLESYQDLILNGNTQPLFGRSSTYRSCSLSPFGLGISNGLIDEGHLKNIKTHSIKQMNKCLNIYLDHDGLQILGDKENYLSLEPYSGFGSPNWIFKAFSFLMIPENHSFWQTPTENVPSNSPVVHEVLSKMLYSGHGNNGVSILFNMQGGCRRFPLKYNRFAFNNYLPSSLGLPAKLAINSLAFEVSGQWVLWRSLFCEVDDDRRLSARLSVDDLPSANISLSIELRPNGYQFSVLISGAGSIRVRLGGFPLYGNVEHRASSDRVILSEKNSSSELGIKGGPGTLIVKKYNRFSIPTVFCRLPHEAVTIEGFCYYYKSET